MLTAQAAAAGLNKIKRVELSAQLIWSRPWHSLTATQKSPKNGGGTSRALLCCESTRMQSHPQRLHRDNLGICPNMREVTYLPEQPSRDHSTKDCTITVSAKNNSITNVGMYQEGRAILGRVRQPKLFKIRVVPTMVAQPGIEDHGRWIIYHRHQLSTATSGIFCCVENNPTVQPSYSKPSIVRRRYTRTKQVI